jgi:hypothetical protein
MSLKSAYTFLQRNDQNILWIGEDKHWVKLTHTDSEYLLEMILTRRRHTFRHFKGYEPVTLVSEVCGRVKMLMGS